MKKIIGMISLLSMFLLATGCNSSSGNESATNGDRKLRLGTWDDNQSAGIRSVLDDFEQETGIEVEIEVSPWDQYWTMLEAAATGGELPDVFWMHTNDSAKYANAGVLMDLNDLIDESESLDLSNFPKDLVEVYQGNDGHQYAIPKDWDTIGLWYNKTMFDEAGLDYPDESWNWDTLKSAAEKLTTEDHFGFSAQLSHNQGSWYNFVYQNGGEIISKDKKNSGFDKPETIEAVEYIVDMMEKGYAPNGNQLADNGSYALFKAGKTAMITTGPYMVGDFMNDEYVSANANVAPLPSANDGTRASIYNGLGWAAASNTDMPEETQKLIEYLGSKDAQTKLSKSGAAISAYKGTESDWVNITDKFDLNVFIDAMDYAVIRPYSDATVVWENRSLEKLAPVWALEANVKETLIELADEMDKDLAEE